jgi:hypothetical protein
VVLDDCQVVWLERFPALHRSKRLADQLKVGGESSLLEIAHGFGHGHVGLNAHTLMIKHGITWRQPTSFLFAHVDHSRLTQCEACSSGEVRSASWDEGRKA